ncbi:MAG: tetratricopeptide repeat protein, partial [Planctomycetes bacterium]|nr:tetratricopeptide repeat protein [Planctomycetota bacterium]
RAPQHSQARLLEGELRIKRNRIDSTEVLVGNPKLQTAAIPGRELTLKLQDRNLSIIRGGQSIPILVTTSKGKDLERLKLTASAGDSTMFSGTIETALGTAVPNNLRLELVGDDIVSYVIDPDFQKANELNYPPKDLDVRSNARLVASSGQILTEEEREKRQMEEKMSNMGGEDISKRLTGRSETTVRPGSPIFVQVEDPDRDVSNARDVVRVQAETSFGDILSGFELEETEAHSGIFKGQIPTGIPFPMAKVSDAIEGQDVNEVINLSKNGVWISLEDAKKPKWIEVDTMSSVSVKEASIEMPNVGDILKIRLVGMLSADEELIATYPEESSNEQGGLVLRTMPQSIAQPFSMRRFLSGQKEEPKWLEGPSFTRKDLTGNNNNGWMISQAKGAFWLKESMNLELKLLNKSINNGWELDFVYLDGQEIMGGDVRYLLDRSVKVSLAKGAHMLEILNRDHWGEAEVVLGYRNEAGEFAPLPREWFSVRDNPEFADYLKPRGEITPGPKGFIVKMKEPRRYRRLRWIVEDYSGKGVSVEKRRVIDEAGKVVIPCKEDFSVGRGNRTLEVAAGEEITISYEDQKRLGEDSPVLSATLDSSYCNGSVRMAFEDIRENEGGKGGVMAADYLDAKRIRKGDQLMVIVQDDDEDLKEEADSLKVVVRTSGKEELELTLLEVPASSRSKDPKKVHSGLFMQILSFGDVTKDTTIKVASGDTVSVSYLDRENTSPGVPFAREYSVSECSVGDPYIRIYRSNVVLTEDKSPKALAMIEKMRLHGDNRKEIKIFMQETLAQNPDWAPEGEPIPSKSEKDIRTSVSAPLLIEMEYPRMALHKGSIVEIQVLAESELQSAKAENREPLSLSVPLSLTYLTSLSQSKAYPVKVKGGFASGVDLLEKGLFAGIARLQLGSPGDEIDDSVKTQDRGEDFSLAAPVVLTGAQRNTVPTLIVSGSDNLLITFKDDKGVELINEKVSLLSDAHLELMDSKYEVENKFIHLGQQFYLRLTDLDHDLSGSQDVVRIKASASSGDELNLALSETLPHSGVFTTSLQPVFFVQALDEQGQPLPPDKGDDQLSVLFGDNVLFTYEDDKPLSGTGIVPSTEMGQVHLGADGELVCFSKRFDDPEMAVKTSFLMAECLFMIAEHYKELNQKEQAAEELAHGKRVLEEAMRDHPDTKLITQGDFLLANLEEKLENYRLAVGRYSSLISNHPDDPLAARAQHHMAICLEKMEKFELACEEYVKLTYIYPNSPLVADATLRLGNYYHKFKLYSISGRVFLSFAESHKDHELASKSLFLSGEAAMYLKDYTNAITRFTLLTERYASDEKLMPVALYWLGEALGKNANMKKSYQVFKKLTWDYPSSQWAKIARGRLTEPAYNKIAEQDD